MDTLSMFYGPGSRRPAFGADADEIELTEKAADGQLRRIRMRKAPEQRAKAMGILAQTQAAAAQGFPVPQPPPPVAVTGVPSADALLAAQDGIGLEALGGFQKTPGASPIPNRRGGFAPADGPVKITQFDLERLLAEDAAGMGLDPQRAVMANRATAGLGNMINPAERRFLESYLQTQPDVNVQAAVQAIAQQRLADQFNPLEDAQDARARAQGDLYAAQAQNLLSGGSRTAGGGGPAFSPSQTQNILELASPLGNRDRPANPGSEPWRRRRRELEALNTETAQMALAIMDEREIDEFPIDLRGTEAAVVREIAQELRAAFPDALSVEYVNEMQRVLAEMQPRDRRAFVEEISAALDRGDAESLESLVTQIEGAAREILR